jgi:hypothetical protein
MRKKPCGKCFPFCNAVVCSDDKVPAIVATSYRRISMDEVKAGIRKVGAEMSEPTLTQAEIETLERMVDRCSMARVLEGLAEVCELKAEHLRANWQDERSAKSWEREADAISKLAAPPR